MFFELLQEDRYLKLPHLVKWLEEKKYLQAVKTKHLVEHYSFMDIVKNLNVEDNVEFEYHVGWQEIGDKGRKTAKVLVIRKETTFHKEVC